MPISIDQEHRVSEIKRILNLVFNNDASKAANFDYTIKLVDSIIDFNKIEVYIKRINNVLHLDKQNADHNVSLTELVGPIREILKDIFKHVEKAKSSLTRHNRNFIRNNVDLFALVCIISIFLKLDELDLLDPAHFVELLKSISRVSDLTIDMDIPSTWKNCFGWF